MGGARVKYLAASGESGFAIAYRRLGVHIPIDETARPITPQSYPTLCQLELSGRSTTRRASKLCRHLGHPILCYLCLSENFPSPILSILSLFLPPPFCAIGTVKGAHTALVRDKLLQLSTDKRRRGAAHEAPRSSEYLRELLPAISVFPSVFVAPFRRRMLSAAEAARASLIVRGRGIVRIPRVEIHKLRERGLLRCTSLYFVVLRCTLSGLCGRSV
jgi:hypothetical protein